MFDFYFSNQIGKQKCDRLYLSVTFAQQCSVGAAVFILKRQNGSFSRCSRTHVWVSLDFINRTYVKYGSKTQEIQDGGVQKGIFTLHCTSILKIMYSNCAQIFEYTPRSLFRGLRKSLAVAVVQPVGLTRAPYLTQCSFTQRPKISKYRYVGSLV